MGSSRNQYFAALVVNLGSAIYGTAMGWMSPCLPILQSADSPLDVPLTAEDGSIVGGLICVGAVIGSSIFKYLVDKIGRKKAACLMAVPYLINWICLILATNSAYIFAARVFAGLGAGGTFLVTPLYVAEIAEDRIRGRLGSLFVLSMNGGILFVYVMGALVSYNTLSIIMTAVPILYFVGTLIVPDSPIYLARSGKLDQAVESLKWFRGIGKDEKFISENIQREIMKLHSLAQDTTDIDAVTSKKSGVSFSDLLKPVTLKGFVISFALMSFQSLSGQFGVLNYAAFIFEEAGSSLSPNISAIIIGVILILGSYIATSCVERYGRKILLTVSCAFISVSVTVLGLYSYLKEQGFEVQSFGWIPVAALSLFEFMYAVGLGPVAFVVVLEVFSYEMRPLASTITQTFSWTCTFLTVTFFNTLVQALGLYGCFWFFGVCMVGATLFCWLHLFETKGRSLDSILLELEGKKPTNHIVKN